jgi:hypothetical protein
MTIKATIYRGEIRKAFPTHEHPDPAEHLAQDPHGFMQKWMAPHYPFSKDYRGYGDVTVGQHWTRSPQVIPERFAVEPFVTSHTRGEPIQPGVPMGKREATAVGRREWVDVEHHHAPVMPAWQEGEDWEQREQKWQTFDLSKKLHEATLQKYSKYVDRAEREGINTFQDLSGGDPDRPGKAKPFRMGVIWHGEAPDEWERGTSYEDEHNLPVGSKVRVTGARVWIPRTGEIWNPRAMHPSTFTPEEHLAASLDMQHRSAYSGLSRTSSVPWNRIQFPEPIDVPVEGRKYWSR